MKLITRQTLANEAADRWARQYENYSDDEKTVITARLRALGPSPSPEEVDATIGNTSWTKVGDCDECGRKSPPFLVEVGEAPDYESATAYLCGHCIGKLARLIAHPQAKSPGDPTP